jgi:hypothetical protein
MKVKGYMYPQMKKPVGMLKFYGRHHELIDRYGMSCVPNDNGPSTLAEHLLSPQFF